MFKELKDRWNNMAFSDKLKVTIGVVCDLGAGYICNALTGKLVGAKDSRLKRLTVRTTMFGLSMLMGNAASGQIGTLVDAFTPPATSNDDDDEEEDDA